MKLHIVFGLERNDSITALSILDEGSRAASPGKLNSLLTAARKRTQFISVVRAVVHVDDQELLTRLRPAFQAMHGEVLPAEEKGGA